MISILFRILVLVFILWLFRRFFAAFTGAQKQAKPKDSNSTVNHMVKDPVCGMYMDARLAVRHESRKKAFYFCSEECKKKFLSKSAGQDVGPAAAG